MLANLPLQKPLVFDFKNSQTLPPAFTFKRESSGSYCDSDGLTKYAGNNIPRFTYEYGGDLLVEPSSNNLLLNSDNIDTFLPFEGMTYTAHPDGWFSFKNDPVRPSSAVQFITPVKLGKHTLSAVMKYYDTPWAALSFHISHIPSGNKLIEYVTFVNLKDGSQGALKAFGLGSLMIPIEYFSVDMEYLGDGSYKCSIHCNVTDYPNAADYVLTGAVMYAFVGDKESTRVPNGSVYYKNPQLENSSSTTSFIKTTATESVTRAADFTSYDLSGHKAVFIKGIVPEHKYDAVLSTVNIGEQLITFGVKGGSLVITGTGGDVSTQATDYKLGVCILDSGDILYGINGVVKRITGNASVISSLNIASDAPQLFSNMATYRVSLKEVEFMAVLSYQ